MEITSESRSGNQAGKFSISGTTTATFLYQVVPVIAGQTYQLSGFAKIKTGSGEVYLKVSFYSLSDGSGSELSNAQSSKAAPAEYTSLAVDPFEVPPEANSVKVKAYLDPSGEQEVVAHFDDFNFERALLPTATPTPTEAPTNTPTPTPTSTGTPTNPPILTPTPTPTPVSNSISGSFSSPQTVGEEFDISVTLSNFEASKEYYLKARIGPSESELNKGETYGGGSWYSDTSSWSNFPKITTNSSGNYSGSITAKLKSEQSSGNYKLRVRARKVDSDSNYDSSAYDITFNSAASSPTSTPTLTPTPSNTPTPSKSPTQSPTLKPTAKLSPSVAISPEILGETATAGNYLLSSSPPVSTPSSENAPERKNFLPPLLIFFGIILIGASIFSFRLIKH